MTNRILLVDSEPRWVSFAKSDLDDYAVSVATSSKDALKQLEADGFDLVIASAKNLDLLETMRERFADKHVIVVTMSPSIQEARDAYKSGAMRYFPKSFSPRTLGESVREMFISLAKGRKTVAP